MTSASAAGEAILDLPVGTIELGERLRPVDPVWAEALGAIMARDGQLTPIEVCRLPGKTGWTLVTGAHRLAGARAAGLPTVRAIAVSADRAERRLREVSENLWRRDLAPLDRAAFVGEMFDLLRARAGIAPDQDGRVASIHARWGQANKQAAKNEAKNTSLIVTLEYGWAENVAEAVGLSRPTIYRDVLLHKGIAPAIRDELRALPGADNATLLRKFAELPWETQAAVVRTVQTGAATDLKAAIDQLKGKPPAPDAATKRLSTLLGTLTRMGRRERQAAFDQLAETYTHELRQALVKALHPVAIVPGGGGDA